MSKRQRLLLLADYLDVASNIDWREWTRLQGSRFDSLYLKLTPSQKDGLFRIDDPWDVERTPRVLADAVRYLANAGKVPEWWSEPSGIPLRMYEKYVEDVERKPQGWRVDEATRWRNRKR